MSDSNFANANVAHAANSTNNMSHAISRNSTDYSELTIANPNQHKKIIELVENNLLSVHRLLSLLLPNAVSQRARDLVYAHLAKLIQLSSHNAHPFMFGSVPLHTFLPDGDIDIGALIQPKFVPTFFTKIRALLEQENNQYVKYTQKLEALLQQQQQQQADSSSNNENINPTDIEADISALGPSPFPIRSVSFINAAEVKIVKCLVGNLLVDVSSNTTSALATVCFLEECDQYIDSRLNTKHLFKHSIILCKAWSCYEARILASHHALLSTYALETLVLFILNRFHDTCNTPLMVLYQFLCFYSNFDFEKYCVTIRGAVPISHYADNPTNNSAATASTNANNDSSSSNGSNGVLSDSDVSTPSTPPFGPSSSSSSGNSDSPPLASSFTPLLAEDYLQYLEGKYTLKRNFTKVFGLKYLNICDPLDESNNLGRSVNYSNYLRIRHAFQRGSHVLSTIIKDAKDIARDIGDEWIHMNKLETQRKKSNSSMDNDRSSGIEHVIGSDSEESDVEQFDLSLFLDPTQFENIITNYPKYQHSYISKFSIKAVRRLWIRLEEFFKNTLKRHKNGVRPDVALMKLLPTAQNSNSSASSDSSSNHANNSHSTPSSPSLQANTSNSSFMPPMNLDNHNNNYSFSTPAISRSVQHRHRVASCQCYS